MTLHIVFGVLWAVALAASASAIWTANTGWPLAICAIFAAIHILMEVPSRPGSAMLGLQYWVIRVLVGLLFILGGASFLYGGVRELSGTAFIDTSRRLRAIFKLLRDYGGNEAVGLVALILGIGGLVLGIRVLRKGFAKNLRRGTKE